jgi:hypothetical protein
MSESTPIDDNTNCYGVQPFGGMGDGWLAGCWRGVGEERRGRCKVPMEIVDIPGRENVRAEVNVKNARGVECVWGEDSAARNIYCCAFLLPSSPNPRPDYLQTTHRYIPGILRASRLTDTRERKTFLEPKGCLEFGGEKNPSVFFSPLSSLLHFPFFTFLPYLNVCPTSLFTTVCAAALDTLSLALSPSPPSSSSPIPTFIITSLRLFNISREVRELLRLPGFSFILRLPAERRYKNVLRVALPIIARIMRGLRLARGLNI